MRATHLILVAFLVVPSLQEESVCTPSCGVGTCTKPNTCKYDPSLVKPKCDDSAKTDLCNGLNQDSCKVQSIRTHCKNMCSADSCARSCVNGACTGNFTCECEEGFQGPNCDATAAVPSVGKYDCPHPWTLVNNNYTKQCIFFGKGLFHTAHSVQSWEGARKICQDMGADLPRFNTMDEMKGIAHTIRAGQVDSKDVDVWVRAYRTPEGRRYWADDDTEVSDDLLSERLSTPKYYPGRPNPTTVDRECLVFRPRRYDSYAGIYNHGYVPCDKNMGRSPWIELICQKWIAEPSPYFNKDECIWRGREITNVKDCKLIL